MSAQEVVAANHARVAYLAQHGIQVPLDQMYTTSLLEYLLGVQLDAAKDFHERRIAPILDHAVAQLAAAEEHQRSAQARAVLLDGVRPR